MRVVVLAKAPVPGLSKTRLQARWSAEQAAALALASLRDTLDTVASVRGVRRELVLEGAPGPWLPPGLTVRPQAVGSLADRLHAALRVCVEPTLLIGMDTPQLTREDLLTGLGALREHDAALGLADDGGWWGLGLRYPQRDAHLVLGVPTSTSTTGAQQLVRLQEADLAVANLRRLRDVDLPEDADVVAALVPSSRFGVLVRQLAVA